MGARRQRSDRAGRAAMPSPGCPSVGSRGLRRALQGLYHHPLDLLVGDRPQPGSVAMEPVIAGRSVRFGKEAHSAEQGPSVASQQ